VFVSSNSALVFDGLKYFREIELLSPHQAPFFLTDRQLAGLAWIAVGGRAAELPRKQLISNCMAAVAPRPDVLVKMRALLADADRERMRDFEALITDERCAHHLMDLTFGRPDLLTPDNCLERFEQIKRKTATDVEHEKEREKTTALEEQRKRLLDEHAESKSVYEKRLQEQSSEIVELETTAAKREQELSLVRDEVHRSSGSEEALKREKPLGSVALCKHVCFPCARRAILHALASIYGTMMVGSFLLVIGLELYGGSDGSLKAAISVLVLFIPIVVGFVQFYLIPDLLFGKLVHRRAQRAFEAKAREIGIWQEVKGFSIDWGRFEVRPSDERPASSLSAAPLTNTGSFLP
jgi:flagellar motility protein MotE (MotC chaperone)